MQRYARGIDRQDRALLRSAYRDGAVDDHVGFVGEVDDFIDWELAYHRTQTRYQHHLLNHTVDIDATKPTPRPTTCSSGPTANRPITSPSLVVAMWIG
jgi:hypothetical protein